MTDDSGITPEGWRAWLKANPDKAAELTTMINRREAYDNLARAFPMTCHLFERCDEELVEKLVACLKAHEVEIVYPQLVAKLDAQTRREFKQFMDLLKAKPQ